MFGQTVPAYDLIAPAFGQTALAGDLIAPALDRSVPAFVRASDPIAPAFGQTVPALNRSVPALDRSVRPLARNLGRHVLSSAHRPAIGSAQAVRSAHKVHDHSGSKRVVLNSGRNHTSRVHDRKARDPNNRARAPNRPCDRRVGGGASKAKLGLTILL
jgi:hypothetical protein